ncbi:unnamed protein product (macronuclear) [Paramecium tetraurelia]|uniref:Uncharacterized protein n=1 Tax=Paramecium tetraurelia TaxID=5888 RepID=A0CW08_PARTE|nr:uncharacterized protein GSPATT00001177001 [Paramecium tetraurelia]CAK74975.1 unnamed protein product [Paramecium tetraurelia]|eukprot:XP_001442372.1 hypothetical protein (macronuclear) [Paramecium tetraurelia strain d4-2]
MGQEQSVIIWLQSQNLPSNNLVVQLHMQNYEKLTRLIEQKLSDQTFTIDKRINQMDDTLLHYAAFKRDKKLVQYLLSKGASPHCKNSVSKLNRYHQRNLTPGDVTDDQEIKLMLESK